MKYYVSAQAGLHGNGTEKFPFKTIQQAAEKAEPGDEVMVFPGIYREHVSPVRGGTDEAHRIIYRSIEKGKAMITGAEFLSSWEHLERDVWRASVPNTFFKDENPYVEKIFGDWYTEKKQIHLGCMFLNHQAMYEVERKEDVLMPKVQEKSWDSAKSLFQWCTWQEEGHTCFQANFQGRDPNQECVEITVRRFCFYPKETGISYIT